MRSKDYCHIVESMVVESTVGETLFWSSLLVHEKKINQHEQEEQVLKTSTQIATQWRKEKAEVDGN